MSRYLPLVQYTHDKSLVLPCKETRPVSHCVHISLLVVFLKNPVLHDTHKVSIRSNPGVHIHSVIDTVPAIDTEFAGQLLHTPLSLYEFSIQLHNIVLIQQTHTKNLKPIFGISTNYFMELGVLIYEICFIFWHSGQYLHTSCSSLKLFIFFSYTALTQQKHTKKRNQLSDILTLRDVHACVFIY